MSRRFTESTFRKYELAIADAVRRYPQVVIVDPARYDIQADTMATRIRDSIKGKMRHAWDSEHVDPVLFGMVCTRLVVAELHSGSFKGHVAIGGKAEVAALRAPISVEPVTSHGEPSLSVDGSDIELVKACACLLAHKIIPGPIVAKDCNIPESELEVYKDVAVIRNGPDLTLI